MDGNPWHTTSSPTTNHCRPASRRRLTHGGPRRFPRPFSVALSAIVSTRAAARSGSEIGLHVAHVPSPRSQKTKGEPPLTTSTWPLTDLKKAVGRMILYVRSLWARSAPSTFARSSAIAIEGERLFLIDGLAEVEVQEVEVQEMEVQELQARKPVSLLEVPIHDLKAREAERVRQAEEQEAADAAERAGVPLAARAGGASGRVVGARSWQHALRLASSS